MGISSWSQTTLAALASRTNAQRRESLLSVIRLVIGAAAWVCVWLVPRSAFASNPFSQAVIVCYALYGLVALVFVQCYESTNPLFALSLHLADLFWPALILLLTARPDNPFFVLFIFPLVTAACRWGFRETIATMVTALALFLLETLLIVSPVGGGGFRGPESLNSLILQVLTLLAAGTLLSAMSGGESLPPQKGRALMPLLQKLNPEADFDGILSEFLRAVLKLMEADRIVLVIRELAGGRAFYGEAQRPGKLGAGFRMVELEPSECPRFFFPAPEGSWYIRAPSVDERYHISFLHGGGLSTGAGVFPEAFFSNESFQTLFAVSFKISDEWSGRAFLFDSQSNSALEADLRFLRGLARDVAPVIHCAYLLRRIRSRSRAVERARVAHDLHDGVLQSLIALEMEVEAVRRQAAREPIEPAALLACLRDRVQQEVLTLRELMQQLKLDEMAPGGLLPCLREMVDRFQRESGIPATFAPTCDSVLLTPRVSKEVAHIVHEALVNVRKHSGARQARVLLMREKAFWKVVVEDDGRGFDFKGRLAQAELDAFSVGPRVLQERVRSIQGELVIESRPGRGTRLEVRFPQEAYA